MKFALSILAAVLAAVVTGNTLALTMTAYSSSLSGRQSTHKGSDSVALSAQSTGDLAGSVSIKANLNPDGTVSGGSWEMNVVDAASGDSTGKLIGSISGGTVSLGAEGWASAANLQMSVTSGSGAYSSVSAGTGAIEGTVDPASSTPFTGTLNLNF